jgi:hypothetical protein
MLTSGEIVPIPLTDPEADRLELAFALDATIQVHPGCPMLTKGLVDEKGVPTNLGRESLAVHRRRNE